MVNLLHSLIINYKTIYELAFTKIIYNLRIIEKKIRCFSQIDSIIRTDLCLINIKIHFIYSKTDLI